MKMRNLVPIALGLIACLAIATPIAAQSNQNHAVATATNIANTPSIGVASGGITTGGHVEKVLLCGFVQSASINSAAQTITYMVKTVNKTEPLSSSLSNFSKLKVIVGMTYLFTEPLNQPRGAPPLLSAISVDNCDATPATSGPGSQ